MIQASQATQYIAQGIENLINATQIKGKLKKSKTSISIYLRTIDPDNPPPKYFRGSNHHPKLSNLLRYKWKPWESKNICIEFDEPRFDEKGKRFDNKWNDSVKQTYPATIKPYSIDVYIYKAANLEETDIPIIFDAVKNFVFTGNYIDPFANNDLKKAKPVTRDAKIKPYQEKPSQSGNISIDKDGNYAPGNAWGADYVSESKNIYKYNPNNCNKNMNTNNKNVVRLKESQLQSMILHSVKQVLSEAEFKRVDNLNDYISQNGLKGRMASKFQRVNAQQGSDYIRQYLKQHPELSREEVRNILQNGAPLSTVASDGTQETNNLVTRNHTILNNVGNANNRWAVDNATFNKKYQPGEGQGVYKPAGKPMRAYPVNEPISFTAPWGEKMNIDAGGQILQDTDNPNDIYGISGKDFENTYKFQESKKRMAKLTENHLHDIITESVRRALNEISKDTIDNAYVQSMQRDVSVDSLSPAKKRQYDKLIANGYQPKVALNMVVGNQRWNFANRINQDITNGGKVTPYNVTQGENGRFPFSKGTRQNKRLQNIQNKTNQQQIQKTVPYQGRWADSHDMDVYGSLDYIPKNYADNTRFNRAAKYSYDWFSDEDKASHDMRPQV